MHGETDEGARFHLGDVVGELPGVGGLGPGFEGGGEVHPAFPPPGEQLGDVPEAEELPLHRTFLYGIGNFGSGAWFAFNNFILPLFLDALHVPAPAIGLLASTRSVEGSVLQPVVGAWSDRIWTQRLGRRRPFIAVFVPLSAAFVLLTPFLPGLSTWGPLAGLQSLLGLNDHHNRFVLILIVAAIFLFTVFFNIMYDPYQALLADISPERQRGRVNGVFQALGAFGQSSILILAALTISGKHPDLTGMFLICGLGLALFFVPTILGVREPRALPGLGRRRRYTARDYWNGLRGDPQVQLYYLNQAFLWFGINAITPYLTLYATHEAGFSDGGALTLDFILLLCSAIFVWPLGLLGDRIGLKRVFLFGMICMAGAALAGVFTHDALLLYIVVAVAGLGNAAQTAASFPLLTQIVPGDQMGLYTGLVSTVTSIAAPASTAIAGFLILRYGYSAMFPFVALMFLACLVPLYLLRVDRSIVQQAKRQHLANAAAAVGS
jgi:maltose/moltooligosaccharide transporter